MTNLAKPAFSSAATAISASDAIESWIQKRISQLRIDAAQSQDCTCELCPESGEYLIEYRGQTMRCSPEKAYAALCFVLEIAAIKRGSLPLR
ncbi:MAG: hypothetical protein AAF152_00565 [Cyanobacteria bacterium P01_A01_bin.114]